MIGKIGASSQSQALVARLCENPTSIVFREHESPMRDLTRLSERNEAVKLQVTIFCCNLIPKPRLLADLFPALLLGR
jgi:hypothetical protein